MLFSVLISAINYLKFLKTNVGILTTYFCTIDFCMENLRETKEKFEIRSDKF